MQCFFCCKLAVAGWCCGDHALVRMRFASIGKVVQPGVEAPELLTAEACTRHHYVAVTMPVLVCRKPAGLEIVRTFQWCAQMRK